MYRKIIDCKKLVVFLLLGGLGVLSLWTPAPAQNEPLSDAEREAAGQVNNLFRKAIRRVLPSVVLIEVFKEDSDNPREPHGGLGSGCIIDPAGYIVTNHHVVADVDSIRVVLSDDRVFEAQEVYLDEDTDLAVVKIDPKGEKLPYASFGDSDQAMVGDFVIAMGNPFGTPLKQTVTLGIISYKGRRNHILDDDWGLEDFIQTDAEINRGNSGGPLVNLYGEIIGINSNIFSFTGMSMGYGFAIPSAMARYVVQQLIKNGEVKRGWLGVRMSGLDEMREGTRRFRNYHPDIKKTEAEKALENFSDSLSGVAIREVMPDSPAESSGLQVDDVILSVNGRTISTSKDLQQLIARLTPEDVAHCRVWRDGREKDLDVKLGDRGVAKARIQEEKERESRLARRDESAPDEPFMPDFRLEEKPKLGIVIKDLDPDLARESGLAEDVRGVLVESVLPDSLAQKSGLKAGDVIVAVGESPVISKYDLQRIVAEADLQHEGIVLTILDSESKRQAVVKVQPD